MTAPSVEDLLLCHPVKSHAEWPEVCYICMESTVPLVHSPCGCKGTGGMVHTSCLGRWRAVFCETDTRHTNCMQCGHRYTNAIDLLPNDATTDSPMGAQVVPPELVDLRDLDPPEPDPPELADPPNVRARCQQLCRALAAPVRSAVVACLLVVVSMALDQAFSICLVNHHCRVVWLAAANVVAAFLTESHQRRNLFICNAPLVLLFPDDLVFFAGTTTSLVMHLQI